MNDLNKIKMNEVNKMNELNNDSPILDLIEQLLKKCEQNFGTKKSQKYLKDFCDDLFDKMGNLSNKEVLLELLDFLTENQDKFHTAVIISVDEEKRFGILDLYNKLVCKIRKELTKGDNF